VDGKVEGPIRGGDVVLKSQAHVVGDIHHRTLTIERGAFFDGCSLQARETTDHQLGTTDGTRRKQISARSQEPKAAVG
jgi:cytoskeletal protein CcmA (bactofilin family)